MTILISSLQNERIKEIVRLGKRRAREARGVALVEGVREIGHALAAGARPLELYVCLELARDAEALALLQQLTSAGENGCQLFHVSRAVFAKIAYRAESGGLVAIFARTACTLDGLPVGQPAFLAVIEGVEKPGNLGAILRTADAVGLDGLVVCGGATDLFNPNVVRASLGALFTVPAAEATTEQTIAWLRKRQITLVAATPDATQRYTEVDLTGPVAIALGSEAFGLSPILGAAADHHVSIPMRGRVDSLNLATSAALLLYEVLRQRTS